MWFVQVSRPQDPFVPTHHLGLLDFNVKSTHLTSPHLTSPRLNSSSSSSSFSSSMSVEKCQTNMSDKNVTPRCHTIYQTKMSDTHISKIQANKVSAILWNCTSTHVYDCLDVRFTGTQFGVRNETSEENNWKLKKKEENVGKMHCISQNYDFRKVRESRDIRNQNYAKKRVHVF